MSTNQGLDTSSTGGVRFAYNKENGDPYHRLGVAVDGYGDIETMLAESGADYQVSLSELWVHDSYGTPQLVTGNYATTRMTTVYDTATNTLSEQTDVLGIVGKGYTIEQNVEAAQFAYDCVGASSGDAIIDTMGVMKNGSEFFVYVRLEPLVLDPYGVKDELEMGLAVRTSHDGSVPLCAYPTAIRLVCSNTVTSTMRSARRNGSLVKVRHTRNKTDYKAEAIQALGMAEHVRKAFASQAEAMMQASATFGDVERTANALWPLASDPTKRAQTMHDERMEKLMGLWVAPTNSGGFGQTLWSAWQTIGEYLDHHRGLTADKRALASIDPDSTINDQKRRAASVLLSL